MGDDKPSSRRKLTRRCQECQQFCECGMYDHGRAQHFTCTKCRKAAEEAPITPDYYAHIGTVPR